MNKAIIGRKLGMSQVFTADGTVIPVTVVLAGPCPVVQVKTAERDGYSAVQLGFEQVRENLANKPKSGHFKKAGLKPMRVLKEFRLDNAETAYSVGSSINCDIFAEGDTVDVTGVSKGHGFTGAIKRWGFSKLKATHGTGPTARHLGSTGSNSSPSRVFPGKKMAGQYGGDKTTVINLKVVRVDAARGVLLIKGAVPGPKGSVVTVRSAVKTGKR